MKKLYEPVKKIVWISALQTLFYRKNMSKVWRMSKIIIKNITKI